MSIPTEVAEQIINHLYYHKPSLKHCSLVCRSWLTMARYHLFDRVTIHFDTPTSISPNYKATLFASEKPFIHYIRTVCLILLQARPLGETHSTQNLHQPIANLYHLEVIDSNFIWRWDDVPRTHRLRRLKDLSLRDHSCFMPEFIDFLCGFQQLTSLHLHNFSILGLPPVPSEDLASNSLKSLCITGDGKYTLRALLDIYGAGVTKQLENLYVGPLQLDLPATINKYLRFCSSLQELRIVMPPYYLLTMPFLHGVNLAESSSLKCLHFCGGNLSVLKTLRITRIPDTLTTLKLSFTHDALPGSYDPVCWTNLEDILLQPHFGFVKTLILSFEAGEDESLLRPILSVVRYNLMGFVRNGGTILRTRWDPASKPVQV